AEVVAWARENATRYGGDPDNIFVYGHSAGAAHVAAFALHQALPQASRTGVAGVILASGVYGVNSKAPNQQAYYGDDVSKHAERATLGNVEWGDFDIFLC